MADPALYDADEAKSLVEKWLSGKTNASPEEDHDENELQAEKSSMLMGLNTSKRSIQQLKALAGETPEEYKQRLLERKKEFAKKQRDYDNENVDSRSSRLGKKEEKKSKLQEILEKKNATSSAKSNPPLAAPAAANAEGESNKSIDAASATNAESDKQASAQQAPGEGVQEQGNHDAQRQRINPLRWLVETVPALLKETGAETVPLTLLGKKFRETFSRHFPGVAKAPMRKFLENARNFKANKPYFCVIEPEGDPQREVYVRMWKEGDFEKAAPAPAPAPAPAGEQRRRKTKTRSKQKNRKKDHRPDALKPSASQQAQAQNAGKPTDAPKVVQHPSITNKQQAEENKQNAKSFETNWDECYNTKEKQKRIILSFFLLFFLFLIKFK